MNKLNCCVTLFVKSVVYITTSTKNIFKKVFTVLKKGVRKQKVPKYRNTEKRWSIRSACEIGAIKKLGKI